MDSEFVGCSGNMLTKGGRNGDNVDSVMGREIQVKWTKELFERLEQVSPAVTNF